MHYIQLFKQADPKTKSFILNCLYLFLLIAWSAIWPFVHLAVNRTDIPKTEHQAEGK